MKNISLGNGMDVERSNFCPLTGRWVQEKGVVLAS